MIYESTLFSIIVQFITSIVDVYGISLPVDDNYSILKEILQVELGVQIVELIFYIWLITSFHSIQNITKYRYADWFITTPVMLITLMAYLQIDSKRPESLESFLVNNKSNIIAVSLLNAAMLLFGFMAEIYPIHQLFFVGIGCIPFIAYFYLIYKEYLKKEKPDVHPVFTRNRIFWYFVIVWSLYAVAAVLSYVPKNTMLNILDLFSKNAFGIMLVYILSYHTT